ncbi:chitin synthase-domain-containing protein [Sporodiniella umbellata]|nr:chitin synthase-domain-containing protein [Sporodiniella umbellata]
MFVNAYTHQEFCDKYNTVFSHLAIEQDRPPTSKCQAIAMILNWTSADYLLDQTTISVNDTVHQQLEELLAASRNQRGFDQQPFEYDFSDPFSPIHPDLASTPYKNLSSPQAPINKMQPIVHDGESPMEQYYPAMKQNYSSYDGVADPFDPTYVELKTLSQQSQPDSKENKMSTTRKNWIIFVWMITFWVPSPVLRWFGMERKDVQIAWREKFTLCFIIFLLSAFIIWFLVFFGKFICPVQYVFSQSELSSRSSTGNAFGAIRGEVFDLSRFSPHHWGNQVVTIPAIENYGGKDISDLFPVQVSAMCEGVNGTVSEYVAQEFHFNLTDGFAQYHDFRAWQKDYRPNWYYDQMSYLRANYKVGNMAYTAKEVYKQATQPTDVSGVPTTRTWAILNGSIYDLTFYVKGIRHIQLPQNTTGINTTNADPDYMSPDVVKLFSENAGKDISSLWNSLDMPYDTRLRQEVCLRNLFYAGSLDYRNSPTCIFSEYLLLIVTIFLCLIIVFKFLAALQFGTTGPPESHNKFVICQVPCYTEGEEELKKTINSLAALQYDDKRKLLFIICDGMITGGGNDRPTPRIALDILGADTRIEPEPVSFYSVGEGQKQHNMAQVYSGLYEHRGHVVPYVVVAKVGKPTERQKPGNRGKRDSQLILMRFLNKVHYALPMTPMELDVYHHIKNVIGVNPSFYEFILMVDADTEVNPDGLSRLVSAFVDDPEAIGMCGETKISNEKDSWVTMIQVYEYFISHYMIKAFESLFGSVTCLPGCFCMYRIRTPTKNQPLLISNDVIEDYQITRVDTLHKKNLLHLGEDRYLTTLILKHFPSYKTKFVPQSQCATVAPDEWSVLLSQRRRWINSTIHNLGELIFLPQLCGFCCFSMRFVVIMDLFSTMVQPALVGYLVYLIYSLATASNGVPIMVVITLGVVYGLQAIIFIFHKKWEYIVWMIVSILAIPVFSLYIPIYSYWHFDDFSWGNTRVVLGDKGKKIAVSAEEEPFDPSTIPTMTWEKYEEGLYDPITEVNSVKSGSQYSRGTRTPKYSQYSSHRPPASVVSSQYSHPQRSLASAMSYPSSPLHRREH